MIDDGIHDELARRINETFDTLISEFRANVAHHIANVKSGHEQIIRGVEAERRRMLHELSLRRRGLHTERTRTQH